MAFARKRLLVVRLISQHEHTVAEIMKIASVCRQTVFTYRDKVVAGGLGGIAPARLGGARRPTVRGPVADEFMEQLGQGKFRQARDAQAWIKKRTRKTLTESGVRKTIRRLGGKMKVPRPILLWKPPGRINLFDNIFSEFGKGSHAGPRSGKTSRMLSLFFKGLWCNPGNILKNPIRNRHK